LARGRALHRRRQVRGESLDLGLWFGSGLGAELFSDADKFEVSLLIWDYGLGLGSGPSSWQTLTSGRRVSRF